MKKLISILLCGALTFTSCSDFLDTDSPSKQSSEVVFETESMAKAALMGIYSSLCETVGKLAGSFGHRNQSWILRHRIY